MHVLIHFESADTERKALTSLVGHYAFKTWDSGQTMVPEKALAFLAREGISFVVDGPAKYEQLTPLRDLAAS